jgi:hypothetical protein
MLHRVVRSTKTYEPALGLGSSGEGLLKWFWPGILGSVKGQLAETLDSGKSFGCRPMTLSGSQHVDQQIRLTQGPAYTAKKTDESALWPGACRDDRRDSIERDGRRRADRLRDARSR